MTDFSNLTRNIYHKQHLRISHDKTAMNRFINMFSTDYFKKSKSFFYDKRVLDAGCGDTGKLIISFHNMGARDIHGFDLGSEFIPILESNLKKYGVSKEHVTLKTGSVLKIPYPDNYFDFVACHGVLVHLNNVNEVKKAFSELSRVTRDNGYLYTVFGVSGGLFEDVINPAIRSYYHTNANFKKFIDNIDPNDFQQLFDFIAHSISKNTNEKIDLSNLKKLFDVDYCVMVQNIIQAPVRLDINEKMILSLYNKNGFAQPTRLKRYVKRSNIRKYFAPLHFARDYYISKMLYGSGNLEFLGRKK